MELRRIHEIESLAKDKIGQPDFASDLVVAVNSLIIELHLISRYSEAERAVPEDIRGIFFKEEEAEGECL